MKNKEKIPVLLLIIEHILYDEGLAHLRERDKKLLKNIFKKELENFPDLL